MVSGMVVMVEVDKSIADLLSGIGDFEEHEILVSDESAFGGDFVDNGVLAEVVRLLTLRKPASLHQVLRLGGYALCEAGMNVERHGDRGHTTLIVYVGEQGIVSELRAGGAGFEMAQVVEEFKTGGRYYQHKGFGFRTFERAHITVTFLDGGRTTAIRCMYDGWKALAEEVASEPMKNTGYELLDGLTMQSAWAGPRDVRLALESYLDHMRADRAATVEDPGWGYDRWDERLRMVLEQTK